MADVNGSVGIDLSPVGNAGGGQAGGASGSVFRDAVVYRATVMRAKDGALPDGSNWVTWTATAPDFAGVGYATGFPTPVGTMVPGSAVILRPVKIE